MVQQWIVLAVIFLSPSILAEKFKNVTVVNGTITGKSISLVQNVTAPVWEFLGIPFAEPPVGNLRFAAPIPLQTSWEDPLVADSASDKCMQPSFGFGSSNVTLPNRYRSAMSEDCLYLNIWTPDDANETNTKAVMVWIHGGAYIMGSAFPGYNGGVLSGVGDVVVVVIQYRLGVFGFMRLDNDTVTGNWGMWDQRLALKWIHENIGAFGGDPNKVTIFGESAGSGSVALHLMSEESLQYFNRAILQSGVVNNPWAYNPYTDKVTHRYRFISETLLKCSGSVQEQLACLRGKTANETLNAASSLTTELPEEASFNPIMDHAFFKEEVLHKLKNGKIPEKDIMIGAVNDEGGNMILLTIEPLANSIGKSIFGDPNATFFKGQFLRQIVNHSFSLVPMFPNRTSEISMQLIQIRALSRNDPENGLLNVRKVADMYAEYNFYCGINKFADAFAGGNNSVYMYEFARRPSDSMWPHWVNTGHADDIGFMFGYPIISQLVPEEIKLSEEVIRDWTNFAKVGEPTSANWRPYTLSKKEFYHLNAPNSSMVNYGFRRDQCNLWDRVLPYVDTLITPPTAQTTSVPPTSTSPTSLPTPQAKCPSLTDTGKALIGVFATLVAIEAIALAYCCYRRRNGKSAIDTYGMY